MTSLLNTKLRSEVTLQRSAVRLVLTVIFLISLPFEHFLFTFFPHWLCFCAGPFSVCRLIRRSSIQGVQGETHIETKQFSSARVVAMFPLYRK